jgi:hypothetical protein
MNNFETNIVGREVRMPIDSFEERQKGITEMRGEVVAAHIVDGDIMLHIAMYGQSRIIKKNIEWVVLFGDDFVKAEE